MIAEEFSQRDSPIHRLDPRVKIYAAVFFSFVIALTDKLLVIGAGLIPVFVLMLLAGLRPQMLFHRFSAFALFIGLLWIFLPLSVPGRTLFTLGRFTISYEGLLYALSITLKSFAIVLFVVALLSTSSLFSIVHALEKLFLPKKLVSLIFLCFRYIHVMQSEYARLKNAMYIRCFRPRTDLHTYRAYGYLVGMLLVKSYDRSERIHKAMLCRGFQGTFPRLETSPIKKRDIVFLLLTTCYILGMVWIQTSARIEILL